MKDTLLDGIGSLLASVDQLRQECRAADLDLPKIVAAGQRFRALLEELPNDGPGPAPEIFTRTVTHDLLNPLNQIIGYAEMMAEDFEESTDDRPLMIARQLRSLAQGAKDLTTSVEVAAGRRSTQAVAVAPTAVAEAEPVQKESPSSAAHRPLPAAVHPLLVVDDDPLGRDVLTQRLERQGFTVLTAADGEAALALLESQPIDLVLLDVVMPRMDGYEVLCRIQSNPALQDVPVLMISGLSEIESVVRCIEMGAADYLTKPFNPVLLQARIGACLEKKQLRDQERRTFAALAKSQRVLAAELAEAAAYVRSLFRPPSRERGVSVDWRFLPSMHLGGDAFGHQWLDDDHLAMYLFDVSGHGIAAALLSVAICDVLRSARVRDADMRQPDQVIDVLNTLFPMELHHGQYFTIWYGVYQRSARRLVHASGGHPPAVLVSPGQRGAVVAQVHCPGMIVGAMPDVVYGRDEVAVPPGARLYVFSDGLFEVEFEVEGVVEMLSFDRFMQLFAEPVPAKTAALDWIVERVRSFGVARFDDDVSMMEIAFD